MIAAPGAAPAVSPARPRSVVGNGAWNLALTLWSAAVTFVLTPFVIGRVGSEGYGLLVLLLTIGGFAGLMNLGLGDATLRFVAHHAGRDDLAAVNRVVGATGFVYLVSGAAAWAGLHAAAPLLPPLFRIPEAGRELAVTLLRISAVNVGLGFLFGAVGSIPQALRRYDVNARILIAQSLFQAAGTVALLLAGGGVRALVLWGVAATLFTQALYVAAARRLLPGLRLRPSPSSEGLREVFGYGVFSLTTSLLGLIWGQADRLILGAVAGTNAVAHLAVPQQLSFRGTGAVASLGAGLFPRFSVAMGEGEARQLFLRTTWVLVAATVVVFVPLTALFPDLLRLWVGREFAQKSAWAAQVIAFSCIVRGAFVPYDALFRGLGKPQYLTAVFAATAATSLALNLALIPAFGLAGAGYCYVATTLWGFAALVWAWRRLLGAASWAPLARAVALPVLIGWGALAAIAGLRGMLPEPGWLGFLGAFGLAALVVGALVAGAEALAGGPASHAGAFAAALRRQIGEWRGAAGRSAA